MCVAKLTQTYSGLFLVAVNPYHALPIYSEATVEQYKGMRREANPPHIFAVADGAIQNMIHMQENQSLLITGESGAGKTENTKRVIQYLAAVAVDADADAVHASRRLSHEPLGLLERQILQANPILEAFGNAQTVRNNNSSRFGKFIRIEFTAHGAIAGGHIEWYLLEKSRVHSRSTNERNFHIFYQLLRSRDKGLLDALRLTSFPDSYAFLKSSRKDVEGVDDSHEWHHLRSALQTMGFSEDEEEDLFRVVAAILHLGNLEIAEDRSEQARITNPGQLDVVCDVLGVEPSKLSSALVRPTVRAGRETVTQARNKKQVTDEIAALCKTMYEKTFGWLVDRINHVLDRPTSKSRFIGVLDIAGFEIFETNSFEQLCINYTNERLQQFFNHHMFMLEQEEYAREHIQWDYVNFGLDLQPTIDLIESTSPIGILSCLDEECIMPKASDQTFTDKLSATWQSKSDTTKFVASRQVKRFVVRHYAGNVEYNTEQWLDKNRDPLNENVARVLAASHTPFLAGLFAEFEAPTEAPRGGRRGAFRTVGQRHKEQLASLMAQLDATQPHFVRCIVPNSERKPGRMELPLVLDQLRCNGVLEGIRIARLGYPNRLLFSEFCSRYALLAPDVEGGMDGRLMSQRIAKALPLADDVFKIGLTKIFFKAGVLAEMEEHRDACLHDIFTRFNAAARRAKEMRRLQKRLRRAAATITIQEHGRAYAELQRWPWWRLYTKLLPLLAASQDDEERKRRELEQAMARERAQRDEQERAALATLEAQLAAERERCDAAARDAAQAAEALAALEGATATLRADADSRAAEHKALSEQLSELQAAHDALEQDVVRLTTQLEEGAQRESEMAADLRGLSTQLDAALSERADLEKAKESAEDQYAQLQEALASARAALHEHTDAAEAHVRDLGARHENELQSVRAELEAARSATSTNEAAHDERRRALESQIAAVNAELAAKAEAQARAEQRASEHEARARDVAERSDASSAALAAAEQRASNLEKKVAALEAQHTSLSEKHAANESGARALIEARDVAQNENRTAQRALTQEKSARESLEAKVGRLEAQYTQAAAEAKSKGTELAKAQSALSGAEAEHKRLMSVQNKTIVEHVHVLEEAKKYTDRQLSDVQTELQELTSYTKSLERTRQRLQQDNEQLAKAASATPERDDQAEKERDAARDELRKVKQSADLTLRQVRAEYETRIKKLEDEMRHTQRNKSLQDTDRVLSDLRSERKMSSAARKVLEELRLENERLEQDLAAKATALRRK